MVAQLVRVLADLSRRGRGVRAPSAACHYLKSTSIISVLFICLKKTTSAAKIGTGKYRVLKYCLTLNSIDFFEKGRPF